MAEKLYPLEEKNLGPALYPGCFFNNNECNKGHHHHAG